MCCRETCASEFQWKNFGFSGVSRERFYMWQWRVPPVVIVVYKILVSAYLISTFLYNILTYHWYVPWPVYVTYWTYALLTTYHVAHTVVVLHHVMSSSCHACFSRPSREEHHRHFQELKNSSQTEGSEPLLPSQQENDDLPLHLVFLWILYSVLNVSCPIITCLWYATIATKKTEFLPRQLFLHAMNSVVVLVEQMVSAIPVRLFHFIFPSVYGLLYYLFSILYWMADHGHVWYGKLLDWNHPALPFVMVILTNCMNVVFHLFSYGIYRVKSAIYHIGGRGSSGGRASAFSL